MLPKSIQNLIDQFTKLPGIGPRMAARITFYLLTKSISEIENLSAALQGVTTGLKACESCGNMSETDLCLICQSSDRLDSQICVVEEPLDVVALEKARIFKGKYHVLGGVISPINGIGPEHLRINLLLERVKKVLDIAGQEGEENGGANGRLSVHSEGLEVILATNPSLEGEATASYLTDKLSLWPIKITRIARGLPMGSDIEFADPTTLSRALEGRREVKY